MRNPYKNIRYFTCNGKYAIMDSEKKEAAIVSVHDTLDEAVSQRKENRLNAVIDLVRNNY